MNGNPRPLRYARLWRIGGHALLLLALAAALLPAPQGLGRIDYGDKLLHAGAFAFLMLWYAQVYAGRRERLRCACGLIGFGLTIELLQALVPYRAADIWDLVADGAGVMLGLLLARTWLGSLLSRFEIRPAA
ncbi:MAG TPA: VanZ family protein [Tahibacter sp.]|uniref:VanZ family protein n=1 Tax=Tahibacter sp. TaxID=2056211 RepID=UPI002B5F5994|nr:VanZ family protein [Tahibacter sp.]HSX58596.1 VanZ family protein [Tahibacter sp.]